MVDQGGAATFRCHLIGAGWELVLGLYGSWQLGAGKNLKKELTSSGEILYNYNIRKEKKKN